MQLHFKFADGITYDVECTSDETVLEAARRGDVPILSQCESGACASCAVRLVDGTATMRSGASSLLPSEAADGLRLSCRTVAASDCKFSLDYNSANAGYAAEFYESNISEIEWLSDSVVRLRLELPSDDWFEFIAGQFVQVNVPGTDVWRSYSMASGPGDMPALDLLIRILPTGIMSNYLRNEAEIDDLVRLEGPFGAFQLQKSKAAHLFIAGGTGLAPFLSMFDEIRKYSGTKPPIRLVFGTHSEASLFALEALEDAAYMLPSLATVIALEQGTPSANTVIGTPAAAIAAADVSDPETRAYLCGPPAMIAAIRDRLIGFGLPARQIFAEQFVATSE